MLSFVIDLKRKKYLAVIDQIIYKEFLTENKELNKKCI